MGAAGGLDLSASALLQPNASSLDLLAARRSVEPILEGPQPVLPLGLFAAVSAAASGALSQDNYRELAELSQFSQLFGGATSG